MLTTFKDLYGKGLDAELGDCSLDAYTLELRQRAINEGYRWVNREARVEEQNVGFTLPKLTATFDLPERFSRFNDDPVAWTPVTGDPVMLERKSFMELEHLLPNWQANLNPGTPLYFVFEEHVVGPRVTLVPTPNLTATVRFGLHEFVPDMVVDSDKPWGGKYNEWNLLLLFAATVFLHRWVDGVDLEATAIQRRDDELNRFKRWLSARAPVTNVRLPVTRQFRRFRCSI